MNPAPARTAIRRLFVLLCGFEDAAEERFHPRPGRPLHPERAGVRLPAGYRAGWVLLDAGMNPANGRDAARMEEKFWRFNMCPP